MRVLIVSTLAVLISISQGHAAPSVADRLMTRDLINDDVDIMNGEPKPTGNVAGYSFASGEVWQSDKAYRARVDRMKIDADDVTRLTQVKQNGNELFATATSYYTDRGLRSSTGCFGSVVKGVPGEMHCATASVRLCGIIREAMDSPGKFANKDAPEKSLSPELMKALKRASRDDSLKDVAKECGTYFDALAQLTEIAARGQPFELQFNTTVKQDQEAIVALVAKNYGVKKLIGSPVSVVGSSLSEMYDQAKRVQASALDARAMAHMISECNQRNFVYPKGLTYPSVVPEKLDEPAKSSKGQGIK